MTNNQERVSELMPCPFPECGGEAEIVRKGTRRASMIIACMECGCRLESGDVYGMTEPKAWLWNRRRTGEATDIEMSDVIAWADGIHSALGTEYASRVTENEAYIADCILRGYRTPTREKAAPAKLSDAPCNKCGYNGVGYYQPDTHPCAKAAPEDSDLREALEIGLKYALRELASYNKVGFNTYHVERDIEKIRAAASSGKGEKEWQPPEECPKNGEIFIANAGGKEFACYYVQDRFDPDTSEQASAHFVSISAYGQKFAIEKIHKWRPINEEV